MSRGLGDVYKRQRRAEATASAADPHRHARPCCQRSCHAARVERLHDTSLRSRALGLFLLSTRPMSCRISLKAYVTPPVLTARLCTVAAPAAPGCSSCPPAAPRTAAPAGNGSGGRPHEASDRSDTPVRVLTSQSYPASAALASRGGWRLLMLSESLTSLRPTSTGRESDFIAI